MSTLSSLPAASVEAFRNGMALLPGAVNIVTTDGIGGAAGFTASAVCSVTDSPPSLLVCLNRSSSAAAAFGANDAVCVNTVGPDHLDVARLFGGKTPMAERFAAATWRANLTGAPILEGATVAFDCRITARHSVGSHDILICEIHEVITSGGEEVAVYHGRKFHTLG